MVCQEKNAFGTGILSNLLYIWVAFGLEGGNQSSGAGW